MPVLTRADGGLHWCIGYYELERFLNAEVKEHLGRKVDAR